MALLCGAATADDWPQWRGPNFTGVSTERIANTNWTAHPPKKAWTVQAGISYSGVSIRAGKAVFLGNAKNRDIVKCVDAANGTPVWDHSYAAPGRPKGTRGGFPGPRATPTVTKEHVYTLSQCGQLKCLALADGSVIWETRLVRDTTQKVKEWYGFCISPLLYKGMLHINHGTRGTVVDAKTGEVKRKSDNRLSGYGSPQIWRHGKKERLAVFGWNTVKMLDLVTGEQLWSIPWHTRFDVNAADPIVCKEGIFVTSGYQVGCALLDPATGKRRWKNKAIRAQCSPVVYADGYVYGFDEYINAGAGYLVCVEAATGKEKWRRKGLMGNLIIVDRYLMFVTTKGKLMLADATPEKYIQRSSVQVLQGRCWIPPSYANGHAYCRNNKGTIVCYNVAVADT